MSVTNSLQDISDKFNVITSKPEQFLSVQEKRAEDARNVLKTIYDLLKKEEATNWKPADALPELIIKGFDEEQIWQEIELQNDGLCNNIVKDVATLLAKKDKLAFDVGPNLPTEEDDDDDDDADSEENGDLGGSSEGNEEEEEDEDEESSDREEDEKHNLQFTSEIDDDFFKLCEMENFCEKVEKEDGAQESGGTFDFFGDAGDDSEEERDLVRYNDFFGTSKRTKDGKSGGKNLEKRKSVVFAEEEFSGDDEDNEKIDSIGGGKNDEALLDDENANGPKSSFEERQERLKSRIESLEEEALKEKPWHLKGEVASTGRPYNSLLEEYVEFDRATRPAPVFTEKTTLRLEDIIKQRIKDKSWDDVVRKLKPVEDIREYRKKLVLDQEKSKISLAEIYEQEYVKQRDAAATAKGDASATDVEVEPPAHKEIKKMMKNLFVKLDALSNFHYTPKPIAPEIKIISNLPAIMMEDVAPVSTSDAALLAPEEIKNKPKGELMNKEERTATDKNRERRQKKLKQRLREKEKIKKEKLLSKMSLGLGNKYSKEKAKKQLDKLTKDRNVDKMVESQSKHLKSSSAFFSKLEDEVKSQVKAKSTSLVSKRKKLIDNMCAKKIKL